MSEATEKDKQLRMAALNTGLQFDESRYEFDFSFKPADLSKPFEVHTTAEMVECLARNKDIELDAKVLHIAENGKAKLDRIDKPKFIEAFRKGPKVTQMRESFFDPFDESFSSGAGIGNDFTPLLGGPFYKNLYFYQDYSRMHAAAFYAFHHCPFGKAIVSMTRDFTLGRGFRVDVDQNDPKGKIALALWRAFEQVNELPEQMDQLAQELSIYGEVMIWELPDNNAKITYRPFPGQAIPKAAIPRVRLIDPSNIIEIVTAPEDITNRLWYTWLQPTQWQLTIGQGAEGSKPTDQPVLPPTAKFIYRQIPAEQMLHFAINRVSNEKRGRSDLFPVLGYLKRLRDSVNYSIVGLQKQAAWAIDTSVRGSQSDVDGFISALKAQGSVAPAGSEFVHTEAIERKFLSPTIGGAGQHEAFEWCLSMIAVGVQIPTNYFGLHLTGGSTRASAVVATEPVAKKWEMRQLVYERVIKQLWDRLMDKFGLGGIKCEVTFPDVITADRSAKLKDLQLAQAVKWISPKRAATIAAKEFGITEYEYDAEQLDILAEPAISPAPGPLSTPPGAPTTDRPNAVTSQDRNNVKKQDTNATA